MGPRCLLSCCFLLTALLCSSNAGVMKQLLRHRRPTLPPLKEQNITLPGAERPLVFNHVYNINVPASSLCSVDLDAPGSSELPSKDSPLSSGYQSAEHTINGENQIVFTHRINVPRKACGCAEDLPGLKDLLRRLQVLEGEVSALKRRCSGAGCCSQTVSGDVGTKPFCNGHGNFSAETCDCVCDPGWTGSNCTEPLCPNNCQGRGRCLGGKCECHEGFSGEDCSQDGCAADCRPSGRCVGGVCVCSDGFFGDDCSQTKCLNNCQGRGRCSAGSCVCAEPWSGVDCSDLACLKDCHARGRCVNGTCHCEAGFTGEDCGERTCPNNCQGNGFCIEGRCACIAGFGGEDCSRLTCLRDCNGRGACFNGMCICDHGYQGEDCSQLACLNNCNSRGQCINGQCSCDVGFHGSDCSELSCPHDCRLRGQCVNGQCVCEEGFAGEDCSIRTCPSSCHGRGDCVEGRCQCHAGFSGQDCSQLSCPNSCLSHGRCMDGQCVCDEGFAGEDCGQKACLNDCLARGHCVEGTCVCQEGFTGDDCSVLACPDSCNNRGRCIKGRCTCQPGYQGESCAELSCLNDCQGRGQCVNGGCLCDEGYIGGDCSEVSPPTDLLVDQVTAVSADLRWKNQMLVSEYLVTFVPTSNDSLLKKFTVRGDQTSTTVKALEPGVEYQVNVYAVLNKAESAPISARFTTALPQPGGLRFKSISDTSVEVLWDPLDFPFDSWEIIFRNTKEENGAVLHRLPSPQDQFVQSGLGPGQEYEVSINMVKNQTRGPLTSHRVTTRIDAPRQVEVKHVTDSSALVSWSQSLAPLDKVSVAYSPGSDPAAEVRVDVFPPDKQLNIAGLKPDTQYNVTLTAERGNINSRSVHTSFATDLDAPQHLQTPAQSDTSITLVWTNSRADVSGYRVKYSPISGAAHGEEVFPQGPGDVTEAAITGLRPGTEYGIGVTAVKDERESLPATTNAATELDPPRDFQKEESSETTLTLSWKRPEAKVTGYRLVYVSSDGQVDEVVIPAAETSHMLSDLAPGTGYTLSLTAERAHKRSRTVTLQAFTTSFTLYVSGSEQPELTTPPEPGDNVISFMNFDESELSESQPEAKLRELTVSGVSSDGFHLSWTLKPADVFDSLAIEYRVSQQLWDAGEIRLPGNATGSRVQGLEASTEYELKLVGVTGSQRTALMEGVAVTGRPAGVSIIRRLVTNAPATSLPPNTDPEESWSSGFEPESSEFSPLSDLQVTDVTATGATLHWSAADDMFHHFLVEVTPPLGGLDAAVTTVPGSVRQTQLHGLTPSTKFKVVVRGLEEAGRRSLPLRGFFTTAPDRNRAVANLTLSDISWDGFTASWTPVGGELDSFVLEVTNLDDYRESQNLTLSSGASSLEISGLNPNTTYLVGLYGMLDGSFLEPQYSEATTVNQPMIGNFDVSNVTLESFSISWSVTEGELDAFVLEVIDSDWLMEPKEFHLPRNVRSHEVTGLRPGTDYIAYLYGTFMGSRTSPLSVVASTAEEPALSRLVVHNVTSDRFSLSWRAAEETFDNFLVEVRESARPSQAMGRALPGDARSTVMAGLRASTSYDIKLYASAGGRNSPPLYAVATTEQVPQLGPLAAASASPHNLSLSWSTLSGHFDGFVVRVSDSEQQSDPLEFRLPGGVCNITIANLMDATGYDVELYGISHGRQTPSVLTHAVTAPLPKVENLTISNVTPYGFRVSWAVRQPEDSVTPSGGFSHFHIVVTDSGWLLQPQEFTVPGNQTHLNMWGLITGIGYEVRLTGVTDSGLLSRPLTTVAVTEAEPEVEQLFVSDISSDGFRVSWAAEEDIFDRFVIKIRDSKRLRHPQEFNVRGDERTKVLTGLMGGTEYEIELYGVTLDQRSQPVTGVAQTALTTPKGLHFSDVTDSSAVVHWSVPRSPVDSYRITYLPFEGGSPMTVTVDGDVLEALLPNMMPGKMYQVTVSALKGLEESEPSSDTVTTALDRPQAVAVTNVTDFSALLTWQPSVAAVDGYVISYSASSVSPVVEHVSGNTGQFLMSTLVPGTRYTVEVYAVKEAQKSDSAAAEFTTDVDPPRDLMAVNIQADAATLTWKPPQAAVTGYTLSFSAKGESVREVVLSPTASSYNMAQLSGGTQYSVRLQTIVGAERSRHVTAVFTTVGQMHQFPKDCAQVLVNGETASGVYTIYVAGEESQPLQVYCDMSTDGGGWLVFLRRQNGKLEFFRNWKNYTAGFGNMNDEFWLGLSNLHKITASDHYELRVDLRDHGDAAYAQYDKFTIAEPRTRYKLSIGSYSGTAGDSMSYHQGRPFSTYDNDNDIAVTNCALSYKGAFWYKNCHRVNLMGKYGDTNHSKGINWFHWKGHETSIQFAEMKLRPADFKNLEIRKKRS
ncbi:tenascin-like isoform X2 [Synchiropus splendidus]|uniref:tenascin-like isoform X2 n=1 Tax=Synchiropus splendidus TaxID=270530 RepID=UPI00237E6010|nr:tenascin-like isoform X2 [Synchiropus splendidus]